MTPLTVTKDDRESSQTHVFVIHYDPVHLLAVLGIHTSVFHLFRAG